MPAISRFAVSLVLFLLIGVTAVASLARRVDETQNLRWPHVYEISSPYHQQAVWAADEFERRTEGRYRIRIYPASALGKEIAINESLGLGAVDIIYTGPSLVQPQYPPLGISEYPFTIENYEHWKAYRDSDLFAEIATGFADISDRRVVALIYYGFRHVTANRAITHPDDMRNLKIRVPNAPLYLVMPDATGANATPMPFAEVYLALQQGVVDAQENPLTTIQFKRFYEVQSHINLTGHMSNSTMIVISQQTMERLGPADLAIFEDVAREAAERASDAIARQERELTHWFREQGLSVNEVDRAAFRQLIPPIYAGPDAPVTKEHYERLRELVPAQ